MSSAIPAKKTIVCATGGKSDIGFVETLQRSSPNDDVYIVRVLSEGDGEKKTVDEIFEKYDKMRQLCEKNQRRCHFRLLEARFGDINEKIGVSHRSDVAQALCLAAQSVNASELILGYKNLSKINKLMLGSVSSYCVMNCRVPVTVIKANCASPTPSNNTNEPGVCDSL